MKSSKITRLKNSVDSLINNDKVLEIVAEQILEIHGRGVKKCKLFR